MVTLFFSRPVPYIEKPASSEHSRRERDEEFPKAAGPELLPIPGSHAGGEGQGAAIESCEPQAGPGPGDLGGGTSSLCIASRGHQ